MTTKSDDQYPINIEIFEIVYFVLNDLFDFHNGLQINSDQIESHLFDAWHLNEKLTQIV